MIRGYSLIVIPLPNVCKFITNPYSLTLTLSEKIPIASQYPRVQLKYNSSISDVNWKANRHTVKFALIFTAVSSAII